MMPLKDNSKPQTKNESSDTKTSGALSTDEILSLLTKNKSDFVKETEISSTVRNLFKKITPSNLAEKNMEENPTELNQQEELQESKDNLDQDKEDLAQIEPEKKYTEEEAKKLANQYAKQYYNNGYKFGVKKTTEELQKGEKALAVTLKQTTDNIFSITPDFTNEINNSVNILIKQLCKEVLGTLIENNESLFQEKVKKFVDSIEGTLGEIEVFLNTQDYNAISTYNDKNNLKLSFKISPDKNLSRGDIKLKSGSIEVSNIVSNKKKSSSFNEFGIGPKDLKIQNQNPKVD